MINDLGYMIDDIKKISSLVNQASNLSIILGDLVPGYLLESDMLFLFLRYLCIDIIRLI